MQFPACLTEIQKRQRGKETGVDYRYMPEPDLPPLRVSLKQLTAVRDSLPQLPRATVKKMCENHGLTPAEGKLLLLEPGGRDFFEIFSTPLPHATPCIRLHEQKFRSHAGARRQKDGRAALTDRNLIWGLARQASNLCLTRGFMDSERS